MSKYEDLGSCRSLDGVWGGRSLNGELAESFMGHSSSLSSYLAREGIYTRGLGTLRRIGSNQDLKLHPDHLLHVNCTNSP